MTKRWSIRKRLTLVPLVLALALAASQVFVALADAPQPNPLAPVPPGNPTFAPVPGVDISAPGPAAMIHGNPAAGLTLFAQNCVTCHNVRGIGNLPNEGSDDGTVPALNPIDPEFLEDANGDPGVFAADLDRFVQHGSRPAGPNPALSMIGWGDHKLLSQQQIADVEAYVMQLNGMYWPDRWAPPVEVQMQASRNGEIVTYLITLVNHSAGPLVDLNLKSTLPKGLSYVDSGVQSQGSNRAQVSGDTVQWFNASGVSQGGTLGPFVIVAKAQGDNTPPASAQLFFTWTSWNGDTFPSSAVAAPVTPQPAMTPAQPNAPAPSPATAPSSGPAIAAPVAAPAGANVAAQIVEPSHGALSWGFEPATITIHIGDTVTWTNDGMLQHTVTADDGSFDSGLLDKGASWSRTSFDAAGSFGYHCAPHPWMKGSVVVQ